jgi:methylphosphotriester-DNA--protein-cysteine methyltransferase
MWMDSRAVEAVIAKRFGLPRAPTLVAGVGTSSLPVVFTYLRSTEARPRRYFAKAFKQTTGAPPHVWLSMKRIGRAKQLMNETNLGLAEIALACGFVDQSHFTRTFVKSVGCSPGKWRRFHQS